MRITVRGLVLVLPLVLLAGPVAGESKSEKEIWLAVGAVELTDALKPLAEHRAKRFDVRIATPPVAKALKALGRAPAFLLLVGDYEPGKDDESWQLPPMRRPLYKWRKPQRAEFSTDSLYGDTDGDLVPDFPVGRIPARTPGEVKRVVDKTLAYEGKGLAPEACRLLVWAGAPGYGGTIDAMATGMLVTTVRRFAPVWAGRFLISGDAASPLCGWPPDQPRVFNEEWRKGSVLTAFVAHASDSAVYSMRHEGKSIRYDIGSAVTGLVSKGTDPVSPVVFLTCYSGEFDEADTCLAETMLTLPGGPVAAIAATTESHPLPNLFTGRAMLKTLASGESRLGSLWLTTQREGATMRDFLMENMLKDVEGKLEDKIDVAKLRRDQPLIYAIFGDPALKLRLPKRFEVETTEDGKGWSVPKDRFAAATGLTIGFRPGPTLAKRDRPAPPKNAEEGIAQLVAANAKESFVTLRTLGTDEDWAGVLEKPGTYRFLVTGPTGVAVATTTVK